ncbi:MAG: hypothetical protein RL204_1283 [Bacteroidota bacterium]|jgi:hypothetical protein
MRLHTTIILLSLIAFLGCKESKKTKETVCEDGKVTIETTPSFGEKSTITGQVIDQTTKEAMAFATAILIKDGVTITGVVTDENGHFELKDVANDEYILRISYVGYTTLDVPIKLKESTNLQLGIQVIEIQVVPLKPLIYLYPETKSEISVKLSYRGKLAHTYPSYPEAGWKVTAEPDGTLWDEKGMEYYGLFWEGETGTKLNANDGFIVAGKETAAFLEEKLAYLGLNRREANEFIMFWLPRMENNPYNLIHFSSTEYEKSAELIITPKPETTIRVMMLTQPLSEKIQFPLQDLTSLKKTRKGFTVVEWGGSVVEMVVGSWW